VRSKNGHVKETLRNESVTAARGLQIANVRTEGWSGDEKVSAGEFAGGWHKRLPGTVIAA
jgi:hypothetical protein